MNYKNANLELYKIGLGCGGMTNLNNKEENIIFAIYNVFAFNRFCLIYCL